MVETAQRRIDTTRIGTGTENRRPPVRREESLRPPNRRIEKPAYLPPVVRREPERHDKSPLVLTRDVTTTEKTADQTNPLFPLVEAIITFPQEMSATKQEAIKEITLKTAGESVLAPMDEVRQIAKLYDGARKIAERKIYNGIELKPAEAIILATEPLDTHTAMTVKDRTPMPFDVSNEFEEQKLRTYVAEIATAIRVTDILDGENEDENKRIVREAQQAAKVTVSVMVERANTASAFMHKNMLAANEEAHVRDVDDGQVDPPLYKSVRVEKAHRPTMIDAGLITEEQTHVLVNFNTTKQTQS